MREKDWSALEPIELNSRTLERNRVITAARTDPAQATFDVLRTRILRAFAKRGWTRLGITSPGKGCGKTFISTNLAFSFSRHPDNRTILMDMDLRLPSVAKILGVSDPEPISWFLKGDASHTAHLRRHGDNLALGLNSERVGDAAELIQSASTVEALNGMRGALDPTMVIYDLPPMLSCDDVIGFLPQLDCVLLIVGGGTTKGSEVTECEQLLADQTHLLGVLLNKAEGTTSVPYAY
ncbi:MAG: CpsD/CapB family tyrosine-protein kinase [Pseudomonadota bacterium]